MDKTDVQRRQAANEKKWLVNKYPFGLYIRLIICMWEKTHTFDGIHNVVVVRQPIAETYIYTPLFLLHGTLQMLIAYTAAARRWRAFVVTISGIVYSSAKTLCLCVLHNIVCAIRKYYVKIIKRFHLPWLQIASYYS